MAGLLSGLRCPPVLAVACALWSCVWLCVLHILLGVPLECETAARYIYILDRHEFTASSFWRKSTVWRIIPSAISFALPLPAAPAFCIIFIQLFTSFSHTGILSSFSTPKLLIVCKAVWLASTPSMRVSFVLAD